MIVLQAVADGRLGGGTTHVLQLIETLKRELPVEVHLVTQAGSPALVEARRRGAAVHGLDFFASRLDPRLWWRLARLVKRLRPALIHAHGARAALPITGATGGGKLLYSVHGYHLVGKPDGLRQLAIRVERRCSARADLTIFVSEHDRALAERFGILGPSSRCHTIRNGIDLDALPEPKRADDRVLGFLGRLSPEKNPLATLDVLSRLHDDGYRLVVIGDGPLLGEMQQRALALGLQERVEFRGSLPRPQALVELSRCGVLLVPSRWEGLPLAPLEAMAMGVPVVASAVGGIPEIIEHERTGFLIEGCEPELYAGAIRRLADGELRAGMIAQAREVVSARFSWATAQRAYLDLYREALALA